MINRRSELAAFEAVLRKGALLRIHRAVPNNWRSGALFSERSL
jgi:hypothetical protein